MSGNKTILLALALGAVVGAVAIVSMRQVLPNAIAQVTRGNAPQTRTISSLSAENIASLREMDKSFTSLAEFVQPTVVKIAAESTGGRDMLGRRMGTVGGVGTGVIFRSDGWIVTNDHVVGGFEKVTVELADGRQFTGTVRRAEESDIAVVKIEATGLEAATFADSSAVKSGQFTMAVGAPFDLPNTVTFGHVSALGRTKIIPDARMADGGRNYPDLIQTDAAINQGNSGGPLFNIDGQVIGINTAIASTTGGSNGIGFAIPANFARLLAETLIEKGKITRAALGLVPEDVKPYRAKELKIDGGAEVAEIPNDSPAAKAGIKKGDIILRVGTVPVHGQMDLRTSMYRYTPGSSVDVEVLREGKKSTFQVKLMNSQDLKSQRFPQQPENGNDGGNQAPEQNSPFPNAPNFDDFEKWMRGAPEDNQGDDSAVPPVREGNARLGVVVEEANSANKTRFKLPANIQGAVVTNVESGSVAASLGIKPGHVIQSLDGKKITKAQDLVDAMKGKKWGDKVSITYGQFSENFQATQTRDVILK